METVVLVTEEFWLATAEPPNVPPDANCMLRAAASDLTVDELSGGETLMPSFFPALVSSSVIFSA